MTTYKQIQDSWIFSEWINSNVETFGNDELVIIPEGFLSITLHDIINLNITTSNYLDIIKLANFIMVINVDPIIDEIVRITNNVNVIYEFEDFYKLSGRLKPLTNDQLKKQINEFKITSMEMFYKYGHKKKRINILGYLYNLDN